MIFTSCGKMGDLFQTLPILSAWYKKTGEKADLCLATFPYRRECEELLKMQECIGEVYYVDYAPEMMKPDNIVDWSLYRFNPYEHGLVTETVQPFINIGFRHFPNKNYTEFLAEDHGLDIDWDFKLNIGEKRNKYRGKVVVIDKFATNILRNKGIKGEYLPESGSIVKNLQLAAGASAVKTTATGSAVLLLMSGINCIIYAKDHDFGIDMKSLHMGLIYNKTPGKATWIGI